jgi:hypothetical protein
MLLLFGIFVVAKTAIIVTQPPTAKMASPIALFSSFTPFTVQTQSTASNHLTRLHRFPRFSCSMDIHNRISSGILSPPS